MGWSGSLTASSALGSAITFTPDTTTMGGYTVSSFTAPKKGVYKFTLKGSGGNNVYTSDHTNGYFGADGGQGGSTIGYLLLESGAKVYVGAGGKCSAAFVSSSTGSSLSAISASNLYFVAGGGGSGGYAHDTNNGTGYGCNLYTGGVGGGTSGGKSSSGSTDAGNGGGGTQTSGGAAGSGDATGTAGSYGVGGEGGVDSATNYSMHGGRGGDGYYGGGGGGGAAASNGGYAYAGGGGSGYVKTASLTVAGKTYTSATQQAGGAAAGARGSVIVTYYALAELPVIFDGTRLTKIIFNGTALEHLIYNGLTIYMRRMKGGMKTCFLSVERAFRSPAAIRGC